MVEQNNLILKRQNFLMLGQNCRGVEKNSKAEMPNKQGGQWMVLPEGVAQPLPEAFCVTINITGNVPLSQQSEAQLLKRICIQQAVRQCTLSES